MTDLEIWWLAYLAAISSGNPAPPWGVAEMALMAYRRKESELEDEDENI